jgi:hypothetical protein
MRDCVVRNIVLCALFIAVPAFTFMKAQDRAAPQEAPIQITINPEARVSVALAGSLPHPVPCGTPADFAVKIMNQGFVTSRLEAELVGVTPAGVNLDFHPEPLKGVREELRHLRITLTRPDPTDLTIAFRAHNEVPDVGGRDRIHFVMHCVQSR